MVLVRVEAEVRPTEDPKKVLRALKKLFNMEFEYVERGEGWGAWVGKCEDIRCLEPLRSAIRYRAVNGTFYYYLKKISKGEHNTLIFRLNKQAAFVGVPSFAEEDIESPMGAIIVEVYAEDVREIIKWLAGREHEESKKGFKNKEGKAL